MTHLSFSDEQMKLVLAGAEHVPPNWRKRFFDDVVDRLMGQLMTCGELDDETVQTSVQSTLQRIGFTKE